MAVVAIAVVAVAALAVVTGFIDRVNLKAKLVAAEAAVASKLENVESAIKADVRGQVAVLVAGAKAEAAKVGAQAFGFTNPVVALIEKLEADLKKVL